MRCTTCGHDNEAGSRLCSNCGNPLAADDDSGYVTRTSFGPYTILGEIGRGAMAVVWRAWDTRLEREVAIKEPLFDSRLSDAARSEMGRRFLNEGRAAARLSHPNIVAIHSADVFDGTPVIVMELVEGYTLSQILSQGPLVPEIALALLDQLLDAAGYAHERGVVHRDIKPDNIYVTSRGALKLGDFGIAHLDDAGTMAFTVAGSVLGTPGYMSPEQVLGQPVDARSDLFSIGVVGYEMLTGHNPFGELSDASMVMLLHRIAYEPARPIGDLLQQNAPESMCQALMAALEKDPEARPQSAAAFKTMLHGFANAGIVQPPHDVAQVLEDEELLVDEGVRRATGSTLVQARGVEAPRDEAQGQTSPLKTASRRLGGLGTRPWLPYAIVGALGAFFLGLALSSALRGLGGRSSSQLPDAPAESEQAVESEQSVRREPIDLDEMPKVWEGTYFVSDRSFRDSIVKMEMRLIDDSEADVTFELDGAWVWEFRLPYSIARQAGSIRMSLEDVDEIFYRYGPEPGIWKCCCTFTGLIDATTWTITGEATLVNDDVIDIFAERLGTDYVRDELLGARAGRWTMTAVD